jgi:uncharacterized protein YwqG
VDLDEYVEMLEDGGLGDRVDVLMAAVRPSVRLVQKPDLPQEVAMRSRIGGDPELAPGAPWPTAPDGRHLAFVAQVDLAAMPGAVTHPVLPADGWLHVFYDAARQPWGHDPDDRGGWAVTYTPAGASLDRRPVPDDSVLTAERAVLLEPLIEDTIVRPFSADALAILTEGENHTYNDAIGDWLDDIEDERENEPVHRLLGHPDTIQSGDIRPLGMAEDRSEGWHLLMQFDSDYDHTAIDFGDSGRIYLIIRDQDLAARQWHRTWLTLQCY